MTAMADGFDEMTGEALRAFRERRGWSQRVGAIALGLARSTLVAYEASAQPVPRTVALAVAALDQNADPVLA